MLECLSHKIFLQFSMMDSLLQMSAGQNQSGFSPDFTSRAMAISQHYANLQAAFVAAQLNGLPHPFFHPSGLLIPASAGYFQSNSDSHPSLPAMDDRSTAANLESLLRAAASVETANEPTIGRPAINKRKRDRSAVKREVEEPEGKKVNKMEEQNGAGEQDSEGYASDTKVTTDHEVESQDDAYASLEEQEEERKVTPNSYGNDGTFEAEPFQYKLESTTATQRSVTV